MFFGGVVKCARPLHWRPITKKHLRNWYETFNILSNKLLKIEKNQNYFGTLSSPMSFLNNKIQLNTCRKMVQ